MVTIPPNARPVPGRAPLSRDRIVDTALALAKEHGLSAVSMRRLGKQLAVQPMSLYYHVPSRAALMVLMAERSIASVPDLHADAPWDHQLVTLMLGVYRTGVEDPAVFPVLASENLGARMLPPMHPETGTASLGLLERVDRLLALAGLPEAVRPRICRGLIGLVVGFLVGQVDGLSPVGGDESPESGPDDGLELADLDDDAVDPPPGAVVAIHADDPAADLENALWVYMRGLADRSVG